MLNHRFKLVDSIEEPAYEKEFNVENSIRISDGFICKMKNDLEKYEFMSMPERELKNGFDYTGLTFFNVEDIKNFKECLLKQSNKEKEFSKLLSFLNKAIKNNKKMWCIGGGRVGIEHDFYISSTPTLLKYNDIKYEEHYIRIQDRFILDNYPLFKNVELYWNNTEKLGPGFNYYGNTIITPKMAQELLNIMEKFIKYDGSEEAEYFVGEEYNMLREILNDAINENKYIIHFGI